MNENDSGATIAAAGGAKGASPEAKPADSQQNEATMFMPGKAPPKPPAAAAAKPPQPPPPPVAALNNDELANAATAYLPSAAAVAQAKKGPPQPPPPPVDLASQPTQYGAPAAPAAGTKKPVPPPVPTKAAPHVATAAAPDLDAATMIKPDALLNEPSTGSRKRNTLAPSVSGNTDVPRGTLLPPGPEMATADEPSPVALQKKKHHLPKPGDHVNHYELIRLLGKGGMGSVFLARDNKLGRRVAIKFLHTTNEEMTKRFILEARTTARVGHENIVIIYDADEFQSMPYMVLEYLQGQALTKLISDGKPVPPPRAVELMVPVVRALAKAHEEGIVHRDLKFDNVLVTDTGTIKVLDFGIAKVLGSEEKQVEEASGHTHEPVEEGEETNLTQHGAIMGTLAFMSPEQWGNGVPIDHRTDIWAAGIMMFRMLAGKHPLDGLSGMALSIVGSLKDAMPKLREKNPDVPAELAAVVDRCLLKNKEERWPDALSMLRALEPFLPGRYNREIKIDESPYTGLAAFQESDADRFFGRNNEIASLVNRIRDQPLMGIVGPSGTGKSSFVRAGVVPALKRGGEGWDCLVIRPGKNPMGSLANAIGPLVGTSTSVQEDIEEQKKLIERITREPGYAGSVLRSRARREKKNILVFVDQFEELYTLVPDQQERMAFTTCLSSIADDATSPTRVVLSIRSDFLDRVPEDQQFMAELTQGLFFLTPPADNGLRDALVQPAEMAGYHFESNAIVDEMINHLRSTQGALPLLQFAATKLWENRDPAKKMLTKASYDAIGGIAGALASHADNVVNEMPPASRNIVRSVFLRLVTPERTRAIVAIDDLKETAQDPGELQRVIDQLVSARLLVVQTSGGAGGATVEIVHESLVHTWPTLRRWLDESGEDSAFLEQLRTAAKQWQQKGHDPGLLWRGEVVEEAHRFQKRFRGELPELQRKFLDAVFKHEMRAARTKRLLQFTGVTVLVVMVAASAVALVVIRNAQKEAEKQAVAAIQAESEARKAKDAAEEAAEEAKKAESAAKAKEKERAEAAQKAEDAKKQVDAAYGKLSAQARALSDALDSARRAEESARRQKGFAEESAREARLAKQKADKAAVDLKVALEKEQERARQLEQQIGSPVIDTLK